MDLKLGAITLGWNDCGSGGGTGATIRVGGSSCGLVERGLVESSSRGGGIFGRGFAGKELFERYFAVRVPGGAFEEGITIGEEELCPMVVRRGCFRDGLRVEGEEQEKGEDEEGGGHGSRGGRKKEGGEKGEMEQRL